MFVVNDLPVAANHASSRLLPPNRCGNVLVTSITRVYIFAPCEPPRLITLLSAFALLSVKMDIVGPLPDFPLRQRREIVLRERKKNSPSLQARPSTFLQTQEDDSYFACNRPPHREHHVPLILLHPVFGEFIDNCKNMTPTARDHKYAKEIKESMCEIYTREGSRRSRATQILNDYGIHFQDGTIGSTEYRTDGHTLSKNHPRLIVEVKNELSSGAAEPNFQALAYYDHFCYEMRLFEDASSCLPCFIIVIAGKLKSFCLALNDMLISN